MTKAQQTFSKKQILKERSRTRKRVWIKTEMSKQDIIDHCWSITGLRTYTADYGEDYPLTDIFAHLTLEDLQHCVHSIPHLNLLKSNSVM
jgi:hypothetical protein